MSDTLLYLARADVSACGVTPDEAREAVLAAFRDHAAGLSQSLPKASLSLGPGHGFQAMPAESAPDGLATLKWVAMAPLPAGAAGQGINALICVNDRASGAPLAVLDGDEITLVRTAAMSAAAASLMAPPEACSIGFVGCGLQAHAHLAAFAALYPGLRHVLAFSRSRGSAKRLVAAAAARGLAAEVVENPHELLARSDLVVSMVPGAPGLSAFLDAGLMPAASFASAVDIGRSWLPATLPAFDFRATDSLAQSQAPYDVDTKPVEAARFHADLIRLAVEGAPEAVRRGRSLFCFRGFALADLALAALVLRKAKERGIGTSLPR